MEFGAALRTLRKEAGMSQAQLAQGCRCYRQNHTIL